MLVRCTWRLGVSRCGEKLLEIDRLVLLLWLLLMVVECLLRRWWLTV